MFLQGGEIATRETRNEEAYVVARWDRSGPPDPDVGRGAVGIPSAVPELATGTGSYEGRDGDDGVALRAEDRSRLLAQGYERKHLFLRPTQRKAGGHQLLRHVVPTLPGGDPRLRRGVQQAQGEWIRVDRHLARYRHAGKSAGIPDEQQDRLQDPVRGPGHRQGVRRGLLHPDHLLRGKGRG